MTGGDFKINLGSLKRAPKDAQPDQMERIEEVSDGLGYPSREGPKKRGRRPSPRTGQVHAKVYPSVSDEIADEARRRGVQQGVLIEEAWALYKDKSGI
ncbi:hypothetical protein ACEUZ9_005392 [Paracoccus litorisediminis]|uniref:chromosome partitioning protein ParB n=1 Tax=Paracoccus litorisediminis TaxID=2006130 RepID=UPI0037335434